LFNSFARVADRIKQASNGRLLIKVHGGGEIYAATKEHEGVDSGVLDYAENSMIWWVDRFPAAPLFNYMIAGLRPVEMMMWMLGDGNKLFNEMIASTNVIGLVGWTGTPEIFISTTKPLNTLADLKGLKYRSAGDDGTVFKNLGASVISVPPGEIYEAMKRGVIEAFQLSSPATDLTYHMEEVVKYVYLSPVRQPCEYFTYLVNKKSWAALPDDLKVIVQQAQLEEAWVYLQQTIVDDAKAIEVYKSKGITVASIPKVFEDEMRTQAKAMYDERAAKDQFYAKVLNSQRAFGAAYSATYPSGL